QDRQDAGQIRVTPCLPTQPQRALTAPPPDQRGPKHSTDLQSKSLFFTKLPVEIRLLVYEKLFGWRTVHPGFRSIHPNVNGRWGDKFFQKSKRKMAYYACSRPPWRDFWEDGCSWSIPFERLDISILLSCRQA